ncbi:MAG: Ldh family oxidoreductase [Burkholderiaceae bacterium]
MTIIDRYAAHRLRESAQAMLEHAGMPRDKAVAVADVLVEGDLLGHSTHGLQLLPTYLEQISSGRLTLEGEPETLSDTAAVALWDGKRLPGPWLMLRAIDSASERARIYGLGAISIRRSHHIAALAVYARRVAEQGLVLLLMSSGPAGASVAPFGGTDAVLSPNPLAVGFPTNQDPVLVDVSMSITTNTRTGLLARSNDRLPGLWLQDEHGLPTDDPAVLVPPRRGTLLPLGGVDAGHKGYGLALAVEAFTAGLAGDGRADPGQMPFGATLFVQVVDPAAFGGASPFANQMDVIANRCRASKAVDPARPVRVPGDRGLALRSEQLARGVALSPGIAGWLRDQVDRLGLSPLVPVVA